MIGNPRDAIATALMYLGYSVNTYRRSRDPRGL